MRTSVRWIRRLLDLALMLLVISVLGLVLAVNVGPGLGHQLVVIRGGSMEPAVHLGSVVDVSRVQSADLRPGDVVTVKAPGGVIDTHRITRVAQLPDGIYIETKGDANQTPDPVLVPASAIIGRVDFALPAAGYVLYILTIPTGVLAILCLALVMLFAIWLLEDLELGDQDDRREDGYEYESELGRTLDAQRTRELIG